MSRLCTNPVWRWWAMTSALLLLWAPRPLWAAPPQTWATSAFIEAGTSPQQSRVVVEFSEPPQFRVRRSHAGLRLVVDVARSGVRGAPAVLEPHGVVAGVMIQAFEQPKPTTRLLVTLLEPAAHQVRVEGKRLLIEVTGRAPPDTEHQPKGPPTVEARSETEPQSPLQSDPRLPVVLQVSSRVEDVRFERRGQESRIEIALQGPAPHRLRRLSATLSRLELQAADLPAALKRTLDVSAFEGPIEMISAYGAGARVLVDVEHAPHAEHRLRRESNGLSWSFFEANAPASLTGVARDGKAARQIRTIHREPELFEDAGSNARSEEGAEPVELPAKEAQDAAGSLKRVSHLDGDRAAGFAPTVLGQPRGRYTGRRIDMDFKDADIHNVLRLLADTGRVNIVAADNVSGTVTIRMRNVPWDQALDVVLQAKNLGMDRQGNIIRVAPQADLEREREMAIARRKQELQLAPLETRLIPVSYAQASDIQARARELLSARGTIAVDERTNVMIVRDVAGNLDQVEELTRSLDTQTPQVLIEARIVEATSRYLRDVGVQWGGDASFSAATGNPTGLSFPSSVGLAGGASDSDTPTAGLSPFENQVTNPNFAVNLPAAVGTGAGGALGLTLGSVDGNFNLSLRLSAAETSGMLRILSSPRVLTLDNRQARISQGTLIPFSQVSAQGVQTTFQEAKLQLLVRPHVTADGSISMHVKINRDEPDFNQTSPRGDPTILKREAETELLVRDGHTAVIGGIYTRNTGHSVDQVPFFGNIPLLGLLFQRTSASDTRGELVIFLTPRIVNRAEALGR